MFDILFAMPPERLAAFVAGGLVVNFAPGADAMFATACGIQGGPRVGAAAGLGAGVGVVWHVTLAALGVSALIALYPQALEVVRWAGAGYLVWLAWKAWRAGSVGEGRGMPSAARAFRRGVLTNMLNPKPVLFVLAFLPQFVEPAVGPVWQQIVALGSVFAFGGTLVTMGYGVLAGYAGRVLAQRMGAVNKVASVMFAGLAAKLVLDERAAMQITLLDGGMGQELLARTGDAPTPLWATQVMLDHPDVVRAIHADYFAAGATVATTNTYAIHHDRLQRFGRDHLFASLHARALAQAQAARAAHGSGRIAGSLGPLVASYRPETCPPVAEAAIKYAEIAALLAPGVDFLLCETMASVQQAEGALAGVQAAGKPVWLSVTVDDADGNHLRSGEPVADLAPLVARYHPAAVLVNCSVPEAMAAALRQVAAFGVPFGAYANGFTHINAAFKADAPTVAVLEHRLDLTPEKYAGFALGWVAQGASIVGGCCEVGPAHIAALAAALRAAGHEIV